MRQKARRLLAWVVRRTGGDSGQVTAFVIVLSVTLVAVAGLVLDAGLALAAKVQALDVAQAAARAGAQELDLYAYRTGETARLNPERAAATARGWLTSAGMDGTATATATTVTVSINRTTHTQLLQLIGVRTLHVSASATATAVQGVDGPI